MRTATPLAYCSADMSGWADSGNMMKIATKTMTHSRSQVKPSSASSGGTMSPMTTM